MKILIKNMIQYLGLVPGNGNYDYGNAVKLLKGGEIAANDVQSLSSYSTANNKVWKASFPDGYAEVRHFNTL